MGRSRAASHPAVDNHNQSRGKRKRTASGAEPAENSSTAQKAVAQETSEPKGAFYHCNYCNKDISGKTRIKCVVCPDAIIHTGLHLTNTLTFALSASPLELNLHLTNAIIHTGLCEWGGRHFSWDSNR
ncbi:hypothetical protein ACE6H2_011582 [Prunus campanulata]